MKIDLDELERVAAAALDADFGFFGGDLLAAAHFVATGPRDTLALIARIHELELELGAQADCAPSRRSRLDMIKLLEKGAVLP